MGCRPMPAARDLTRDGRWSTYDVSVHKLTMGGSFRGKCANGGQPLMLPSPTKLARPGHFPPASQEGGPFHAQVGPYRKCCHVQTKAPGDDF
jgi:hypothetical protein